VNSDAAERAGILELALEEVLVGRLENGGFRDVVPLGAHQAEVVLHMSRPLLEARRKDVEDKVIAAVPAHAREQGPALALGVVCLVIALRRDGDKIVIVACVGTRGEDAQWRALGGWLACPILKSNAAWPVLLLHWAAGKPILNKPGGQSSA
jgi:hypothetical protein